MTPPRYRPNTHRANERKFGFSFPENKCGSCYKCAMEFLIMERLGVVPTNQPYIDKCKDLLAEKYVGPMNQSER